MPYLSLSQHPQADQLLSEDPFALMVGMVLDQQISTERAFTAPYLLTQRLGVTTLEADAIAATEAEQFREVFATKPALHRFPSTMADRVHALASYIHKHYQGDPTKIWREASSGDQLLQSLTALPSFSKRKAQIFLALLGKQLGVCPPGWREAAGIYGEGEVIRSVADVTGPAALQELRERKRALKTVVNKP